MADDDQEVQPRETDPPESQTAADSNEPEPPPPTGTALSDEPEADDDAHDAAKALGGPVTGSAEPVSLDDLSATAVRGLIAELPPQQRNRFVSGTLTVHYAARDIGFPMDGESALRMLAVLAGTSNDMDEIRTSSDAQRVWLMIDREDVLGAQWVPTEATVPRRATMDPRGLVDATG